MFNLKGSLLADELDVELETTDGAPAVVTLSLFGFGEFLRRGRADQAARAGRLANARARVVTGLTSGADFDAAVLVERRRLADQLELDDLDESAGTDENTKGNFADQVIKLWRGIRKPDGTELVHSPENARTFLAGQEGTMVFLVLIAAVIERQKLWTADLEAALGNSERSSASAPRATSETASGG